MVFTHYELIHADMITCVSMRHLLHTSIMYDFEIPRSDSGNFCNKIVLMTRDLWLVNMATILTHIDDKMTGKL